MSHENRSVGEDVFMRLGAAHGGSSVTSAEFVEGGERAVAL